MDSRAINTHILVVARTLKAIKDIDDWNTVGPGGNTYTKVLAMEHVYLYRKIIGLYLICLVEEGKAEAINLVEISRKLPI